MKSDGLNIAVVSDNWLSAFGLKCLVSEVSPFAKVFILNSEEYKDADKNIYSHIFDIDNAEGRGAEFWRKFVEDKLKVKEDRESKVCQKPLLTNRETEVLRLVTQGLMNKEIADKLGISLHTVISHRKNLTEKLGIKTVSGLTVYAMMHNLI